MKYHTIIMDPPWKISPLSSKYKSNGKYKELPYQTMTDKEILDFPINDYCHDNSSLFIWTTQQKLPLALSCLNFWEFKYNRIITWIKDGGINIHGLQNITEFLIFGYKGIMLDSQIIKGKFIKTAYKAPRTRHSEKPAAVYEAIRDRFRAPRIDIYARRRHIGYDVFGNEIQPDIQEVLIK